MLTTHEKITIRDTISRAITRDQALQLIGTNDIPQALIRTQAAYDILDVNKCSRENEGFVEAYMLMIEAIKCAANREDIACGNRGSCGGAL